MATRREFLRTAAGATAGAAGLTMLAPFSTARAAFAEELAVQRTARRARGYDELHRSYDLAEGVTYLNHASIGTMPRLVREALGRYVEVCESNPWAHIWGDAWEEAWTRARQRAAAFVGCDADELAITHNTTEAFSLLAQGLPLGKRDEVLFSTLNHVGASRAFEHLADTRGFSVRRFDFPVDQAAELTAERIVELHVEQVRKRTRLLVLPHMDNILGIRHPVREIAEAVKARGVEFVAVDGAQTAGMIPLELSTLGADFFATSGHKWLQTPKGLGLLYVRRELIERLRPMWVTWGQKRWAGTARVFEDYGTRDLPKVLSLADAIDFQDSLGRRGTAKHLRSLHAHGLERVDASPRLSWRSPRDWDLNGSLWAVEVEGRGSRALFDTLYGEQRFVFRPFDTLGLNTLRISPNVANTPGDLDRLFDALEAA